MQWIEMHNMEYGECIVLGGKDRSILMVDCGSMNHTVRLGDTPLSARYEDIAHRYAEAMDRFFLLTHYHRDHLNGFLKLIDANEGYFSRVFLPRTPIDSRGVPLLLEYALFAYIFLAPQSDCFQVNTACVRIFRTLEKKLGADRIFTLGDGDVFRFDSVDYEVLWPMVQDYPFEPEIAAAAEALNVALSSPFQPSCIKRFLKLKEDFLSLYLRCCDVFSISGRGLPEKRRSALELVNEVLDELEDLRDELNLVPAAHDIREILENPINSAAYSNCINSASLVFQNVRTEEAGFQDILMTGDATPETMLGLMDRLYDGYYIFKAPHHGTASGYCSMFSEMSAAHILISNGEYHAGGSVAQEYIDMLESIRHCTNTNACKWFQASGACCNRLCYCYDQENSPGLAIKCPAASGKTEKDGGCRIRILDPGRDRACLCDISHK